MTISSAKPIMATTMIITSTRNPRVVEARKLTQHRPRQRRRAFLVEGLQLLGMALDAGARPIQVFYCESQFAGAGAPALMRRLRRTGAELLAVSEQVMEALSQRDGPQGIVATFPFFKTSLHELALTRARDGNGFHAETPLFGPARATPPPRPRSPRGRSGR